jgi:hypothetical protein
VSEKKKVLIVTDGTESIHLIAQSIKDSLEGCKVKICSAENFTGTDLLPAGTFFLGCEKPAPASFAYLEDLLSHINLASRKCGVFSIKEKTLKYLSGLVKDCEADLADPLFADGVKTPALKKWLKGIMR